MRHLFVFVGPYAFWCFPWEEWAAQLGSPVFGKLHDEVLQSRVFAWAGAEWGEIKRNGVTFQQYFAVPQEARPGAPDRPMLLTTDHLGDGLLKPLTLPTDWTGLDHKAELWWFQSTYSTELARASELFGVAPEFRWGLVVEQD